MRFSTRLCCLVGMLALLIPVLVLQRTSANWAALTIVPASSLMVPVQAPEDIAGVYGGSGTGTSPNCGFIDPIAEPLNIQFNSPTIDGTGSRKVTGVASVGDFGSSTISASLSDPGDIRNITDGVGNFDGSPTTLADNGFAVSMASRID